MHNPEAYTGSNYRSTLNRIWLDFVRGSNATYLFEWSKRAWDWEPAGSEEGGRRIAEKFPWMILNPYAYPAADFRSIMDAKKEIFRFAEYFAPRSRNIPCETAVLLSHPTERMAGAVPIPARNEITTAAGALAFTHRPFDAVLEEQLPEGRLGRYKAVVAVGVRNTLPGTAEALRRFVEAGGILIAGREFMTEDEYGRPSDAAGLFAGLSFEKNENAGLEEISFAVPARPPLPAGLAGRNTVRMKLSGNWKVLGSCGDTPAFAVRKLGQGAVYVFTPQLQDYALGALLGTALERHGIRPGARSCPPSAGGSCGQCRSARREARRHDAVLPVQLGRLPEARRARAPARKLRRGFDPQPGASGAERPGAPAARTAEPRDNRRRRQSGA